MMVFPEKLNWLETMLQLRGSVLSRIWGRLLFTALFAAAVTWLYRHGDITGTLTVTPFTLIGLALSIFLGFRNNTSYGRFWEGRILWGRLVNTSRSFTRQVLSLVRADPEGPPPDGEGFPSDVRAWQQDAVRRLAAYVHAVRLHLRDAGDYGELRRLLPDDDLEALGRSTNPPMMLLQSLAERVSNAWRRGWVDAYHLPVLEGSLTDLIDIQGGCERIKSTPIPFSYNLLLHRIAGIYCLALPFGIVKDVGLVTPLVVLLVSYAFYGLDTIGDEIENPFGTDPHDLPLSALSTMIERNVRELLGDADLPAPVQPKEHMLT